MRSTVIPMECHVVLSPCIRRVAKLSGCGVFLPSSKSCANPKISFSQLLALLLSLSCEISDAANSDN